MTITKRIIETRPDGTRVETIEYGPSPALQPKSTFEELQRLYGEPQKGPHYKSGFLQGQKCPYGPGRLAPNHGRHCNCPDCY